MRLPSIVLKVLGLTALAALVAVAVQAGSRWYWGSEFEVGNVCFQVGYKNYDDYGPDYYYRTDVELGSRYYGRKHRSERCYYHDNHYYHKQECPLIRSYFSRNGYSTRNAIRRHAPRHHSY